MASKQSGALWADTSHQAEADMAYAMAAALVLTALVIAIMTQLNVKPVIVQEKKITQVRLEEPTPVPQKITQAQASSTEPQPPKQTPPMPQKLAPAVQPQSVQPVEAKPTTESTVHSVEAAAQATSQTATEPTVIEATKPVAVASASSIASPTHNKLQAGKSLSIGVACPTQVKPIMPRRALQEDISGSVTARATIRDGKVVNVDIVQAKPRGMFEAAVRAAMLQYQCESSGEDMVAEQVFDFGPE